MTIHMTQISDMRKYYDDVYSIYARRPKLSKGAASKMSLCCDITYKDEILAAVEQCGYGHMVVVKQK